MYRKSRRKKRFYPEFYDEDELHELMQTDDDSPDIPDDNGETVPIDLAERDSTAHQVNSPADYNDLLYPNNISNIPAASVSNQLENMQREYIQKKLEISQANNISLSDILQNINRNEAANINEHNKYDEYNENNENEMRIEIPNEMYVGDDLSAENANDQTDETNEIHETDEMDEVVENYDMNDIIGTNDNGMEMEEEYIKYEEPEEVFEEHMEEEHFEEEDGYEYEDIVTETEMSEISESEIEEVDDSSVELGLVPFDRAKAIEYAHRWALDRNPSFLNFDELGGDCANYISQILLAGGCLMDYTPLSGWYYSSGNDQSPSWNGVEQLYDYLIREKATGILAVEINAEEAEAGDIVQLSFNGRHFQHTPFIVEVLRTPGAPFSYDSIKICAHSFDSQNRALDTYQWRSIRFLRIVGYK